MKHATAMALDHLEPLLLRLREISGMVERKRGIFYRRSRSFLHFHEDPSGFYADLRQASGDFMRLKVDTLEEQTALIEAVATQLSPWC